MDARPAVKRGLVVNGWAPPKQEKFLTKLHHEEAEAPAAGGVTLSGRASASRFTENAVFERHSATDFEGKV